MKYRKVQDSYKNTGIYRIYRTAGITENAHQYIERDFELLQDADDVGVWRISCTNAQHAVCKRP